MSAKASAEPGAVSSAGRCFGPAAGLRWCGRLALVAALLAALVVLHAASGDAAEPAGKGPAAERLPIGVLDTADGGFLPGRFTPLPALAGGRETFAWRSPAFAAPFEFFIDEVVGVRFGPPAAAPAVGPWRLMLQGGDSLTGSLEGIDAETVTLGVAGRRVGVRRRFIEQLIRSGTTAGGLVPTFGWTQLPPGSWREDAGGWSTSQRGAALQRDVDDAARLIYDIVLTWDKTPAFRIAASADGAKGVEPFRVELFPAVDGDPIDNLLVVREEATRAVLQAAADAVPAAVRRRLPAGRLRLLLFVDQPRGRLAVALPESGDSAAVIDVSLPPDAGRRAARRFRLTSGGAVRLDSLRVSRWMDEAPLPPRREGTTINGAAGRLAAGELESFDAAAGDVVVREPAGPRRLPLADVVEVLFPLAAGPREVAKPAGPPAVCVTCLHEQAASGRLVSIDEEALWLASDAFVEPLPLPLATILSFAGVRRAVEPRPLPTRVGTLRQESLEVRGSLVAAPGGLAWQPLGSRTASPFVAGRDGGPDGVVEYVMRGTLAENTEGDQDVGGMGGLVSHDGQGHCVVTRLSPDGAATLDGRIEVGDRIVAIAPEKGSEFVETTGIELDDVMNLLRGVVGTQLRLRVVDGEGMNQRQVDLARGRLGLRSPQILKQALDAHARLAPGEIEIEGQIAGFPALVFMRSGDVLPCAVQGIGPEGIRIRTPAVAGTAGEPPLVPAADVKAVELAPRIASRKLEATRRDRLLTLPRSQRFDPPTHLVRLVDGDYLRGRVQSLDEAHIVVEVPPGEEKRIPRAAVARVIWLHPEELTAAPAPAGNAGRPVTGTRAQGVAANGTRVTLAVDDMQEGRIRGRIAALGPGVIDVDAMDRVLLGGAIDREAGSLPYQQWKLKPAPEPRALRGGREEPAAGARPRIPLSGLAGKPAPAFALTRINARGTALRAAPAAAAGRVLVLEFWSEWSEPARTTLPEIVAAVNAQPAGTVDLIPVSTGDQPAKAAAALEALGLDSTAIDPDRMLAGQFEVRQVPARVIVGADGTVVDVLRGDGAESVEEFRMVVAAAVVEAEPLRRELARLNDARTLAERGEREALEHIAPLLASTHAPVRRASIALLRRIAPTALPAGLSPQATGAFGGAQLTADVRLDREVAAWKRWIAREGIVALLRPLSTPAGDRDRQPAEERGRLLVCLPGRNEVGEFSLDGRKLWNQAFKNPGACAGLPNGHRLVGSAATPGNVVEFDADGKEVWRLDDLPAGVTSVARLPDGNTLVGFDSQRVAEYDQDKTQVWEAAVVGRPCAVFRLDGGATLVACRESDRIVEIDRDGGEISAIDDLHGLQGAVRLANGHVLATMTDEVVELDATGNIVWSRDGFNGAMAADRLADGRTLVLDAQQGMIVELDAAGAESGRKPLRGARGATGMDGY